MSLRRDGRGQASFAWVAVALLLMASGAALLSHTEPVQEREDRQQLAAEESAVELSRKAELEVVQALALDVLEQRLHEGGWSARGLYALAREVEGELGVRLNATYPRQNSLGHWMKVELRFARVVPVPAWVEATGPGGVRSLMELPAYARVEGAVDVEVRLPSGRTVTKFAGLGATALVPALLPIALAGRMGVETAYGGRVEQFVGREAEASLRSGNEERFDQEAARRTVIRGLQLEVAAHFENSGDAAFTIANLSGAELGVSASWALFDGQELGGATWGALTIEAWGAITFSARVAVAGDSFEVGPLKVPVGLRARAAKANLSAALCVEPDGLAAALAGINRTYGGSPYREKLFEAGLRPDANGSFEINASVIAVITRALSDENRAALPPVEDAARFFAAYAATREALADLEVQVVAAAHLNGSRAVLTVDGVPSQSAVVHGGRARFAAVPSGAHNLSVVVDSQGVRFAGGGAVEVSEGGSSVTLNLEPSADFSFLRDALQGLASRGAAEVAGLSFLRSAAALVGKDAPATWSGTGQVQAFGAEVLTRLAVLLDGDVLSMPERVRAGQAQATLKIVVALLGAADTARHERSGTNQSVGSLAGAIGVLAFKPDPAALVEVSLAATKLATASLEEGGLVVRFFKDGKGAVQLVYRLDQLTLVAGALGGALSLAADFVAIRQELQEADGAGLAVAVAKAHVRLADLTVDVAKGIFALADAVTPALKFAFRAAGLVVGAAMVVVEVALLYHEHGGNWSAIGDSLVRPAELAALLTLPGMAGSAIATVGGLVALASGSSVEFGPIGLAAGLFVLAALLIINKEEVASALFGTLTVEAARNISSELARVAGAVFETGRAAFSCDVQEVLSATRAAAARSQEKWLEASLAGDGMAQGRGVKAALAWLEQARALGLLSAGILSLRFASASALEQLDDFASGPFVHDPGRNTEGYAFIRDAVGREYPFEGHVRVGHEMPAGSLELTRDEWRLALGGQGPGPAQTLSAGFELTDSNAIPIDEVAKWADKFATCAQMLAQALEQFNGAQARLRAGRAV